MSRHQSLATVMASLADVGHSSHRPARVLRFIYRHRKAHRRIVGKLDERHRAHELECDARFRRMQFGAIEQKGDIHPKHKRPTKPKQKRRRRPQ